MTLALGSRIDYSSAMHPKRIAVFGAGLCGLAAARELVQRGHAVEVYESSPIVGGLAASFRDADGFSYDNGPRFIFSTLAEKLGILDECIPVAYYEHIHVGGKAYRFPFGLMKNFGFLTSAGLATVTRGLRRRPRSLGEFLHTYYGSYFSRTVLAPLIEKWSGTDSRMMSIDFASRLLPTNIAYIAYSLLKKLRGGKTEDYYKKGRYIVYPRSTNARIFEVLSKGLTIHSRAPLVSLDLRGSKIHGALCGDHRVQADAFLSTIPVSSLLSALPTNSGLDSLARLSYRSIVVLFIKLRRPRVLEGLWTWFPERRYPFYRISEYKNALSSMAPEDKTMLSIEFACQEGDGLWNRDARSLYEWIQDDLRALYGFDSRDVIEAKLHRSAHAYPVLKKETEATQRSMTHTTAIENLFLAGRTGMFQYKMTEGTYDSAIEAVDLIEAWFEGRDLPRQNGPRKDRFGRPLVLHE